MALVNESGFNLGFRKCNLKCVLVFRNNTCCTYFAMELVTFVKYLLLLKCICADTVVKLRLCVDAVVDNYHSDAPVLDTYFMVTQNQCFMQCMRLTECQAFQFRHNDGWCELLPIPEYCLPQNRTQGTTYIELNTCGQYPPRRAFLPPTDNWRWVSTTSNLSDALIMELWGSVRYVSRVFERGMYLPGWWRPGLFGFRTVRPFRDFNGCDGDDKPGELLIFPVGNTNGRLSQ